MLTRLIWNTKTRSIILWLLRFVPICKGQVLCVSWNGKRYNCNPKSIAEVGNKIGLGTTDKRFRFFFAFDNPGIFKKEMPIGVTSVQIGSLEYYWTLARTQFLITNTRFAGDMFPYKKRGQIYMFTGHGGCGIKKIEFDAKSLPEEYMKRAAEDTARIDVMLSGAEFRTRVIRSAYRFYGEVLELGMPRNDVFFQSEEENQKLRTKVLDYLRKGKNAEIPDSAKFLIYTPTFRNNGRRDVYGFNPENLVNALESRFSGTWYLLISSHPNMRSYYKEIYDFSDPRMIDVGMYPDLQELLVVSDVLITDYSSAEMDFSLTKRPIFQLCRDRHDYDRGFYINPEDLPFPYAETDGELIANIRNFNDDKYLEDLEKFNKEVIGLKETGHAADAVVEWMMSKVR